MSQVLNLYRLQKIDTQKDQVALRLDAIERTLRENERLRAAQSDHSQAVKSHHDAQTRLRQAEELVKSQQIKIELSESSLYGGKVHNPKELQDLQNEIASLKRYLTTLEDQQLNAMLVLEEAETALQNSTARLTQVEQEISVQQRSLFSERDQLHRDLERMEAERNAAASTIQDKDLRIYEQLRSQRRGVAVATIDDETCTACGSTLTPADRQLARSPNQISYCSSCGRILYAG
jgi:uncharacterized protein